MKHMNVGLVVDGYVQNRIFDVSGTRDNFLERFYLLREYLQKNEMECQTADMYLPEEISILIFHDVMNSLDVILTTLKANPFVQLVYLPNEPSFVIPFHDSTILPQLPVDIILTWNDQIANKYPHVLKCNIGQPVIDKNEIPVEPFDEKKFICSIFAYKPSNAPGTLFKERINAVDFFYRQPHGMDLYGIGWGASRFSFVPSSYKGPCKNKKKVQKNYKFSIAYENIGTLPGLITEKIFDCFSAGTIPIYIGAPNIKDYIPSSCFIDIRDFKNYAELYEYLTSMSESEYQQYLDSVKDFIDTPEYNAFTSRQYAMTIVKQMNILKKKKKIYRTVASFKWELIKLMMFHPKILKSWRSYKRMVITMVVVW